jgi:hypothetical protein
MATDIPAEATPAAPYPVQLEIERQPQYDKLRALVRSPGAFILSFINLILLLPILLGLVVLGIGYIVVYLISCFAILFTGRFPRGLWEYQVGVLRWQARFYSWIYLLSDRYPPFSFDNDAHPMQLSIEYPERVSRWRGIPLLCGILAIPVYIVAEVLLIVSSLLIYLPPIVPGVIQLAILFTGEYPEGLFNLISGAVRITIRTGAYAAMLTTQYPPFRLAE